jgi:hypothetical protein
MPKDNTKTPKRANLPPYGMEQNTVNTTTSDESGFTLVSYGKKTRAVSATRAASRSSGHNIVGQEHEETIKFVKTWKFKDFQQQIYPS